MKLQKLLQGLSFDAIKGPKDLDILGLCIDSRRAIPGSLFIAKKGSLTDGSAFIPQAIQNGAIAVVTQLYNPFLKITQILCPYPEKLEAELAKRFYQDPSKSLLLCGTTGTNGKTTTTYLLKHLLDALHKPCGLSSTVELILGKRTLPASLTTHELLFNVQILREMVDCGCKAAAIEISSHGLDQGRCEGISLDAALFTNLTPDHLDYHPTFQDYASAKKKIFSLLDVSSKKNKCAIFNIDDPIGEALVEGCKTKSLSFGLGPKADVRAEKICFSPSGTTFWIQDQIFTTQLIGAFNVYNVLGAISLGVHLGVSLKELSEIFSTFHTVPGRLERVQANRNIHVFVDYAHTEDALANVLATLRQIAKKRILVLFGAGGNRDVGRRSGLARAASKGADFSIITTDNPRQEDPAEICRQVLAHFESKERVLVELDRTKAIEKVIGLAQDDDVVLIAGRGHERFQIFAHGSIPFDDCEVARTYCQSK